MTSNENRTDLRTARAALVKLAQILSDRPIRVTQRGAMAFCECDDDGVPSRINLPHMPDDAEPRVLAAAQGYLDHEVAHALFTDFAAVREAAATDALLKQLHNMVEDTLIERRMAARLRGAGPNLEVTRQFVLDEHIDPAYRRMSAPLSPEVAEDPEAAEAAEKARALGLFQLLLMPVIRAWAGQETMQAYMADKWEYVAERTRHFADLAEKAALVTDSWSALDLAREIHGRLKERAPDTFAAMLTAAEEDEAAMAAARPVYGSRAAGRRGRPTGMKPFGKALADSLSEKAGGEGGDGDWRVFSTEHDTVAPLDVAGEDYASEAADMAAKAEALAGRLGRVLERMIAAQSRSHWIAGRARGRLNAPALHRLAQSDGRVFRARVDHRDKNAALSLVVDLSGSMSGSRIATACASCLALSTSLQRVGVAHEVIGFTTLPVEGTFSKGEVKEIYGDPAKTEKSGSSSSSSASSSSRLAARRRRRRDHGYSRVEPLYLPILKGFDERLTPRTRLRFAAAAHSSRILRNNVDHECIRLAAHRLLARSESRRVMIVFSDGEPAFDGDSEMAKRLLIEEVAMLERTGVDVFGVGVESRSVSRYYPRHVVVDTLSDLPDALMGLVRNALG